MFEAGFIHKNGKCYARADVLYPVSNNQWDIIEVKSATSVKEEYLYDISFQKYCYESAGVKIKRCFVLHINNQYVRNGKATTVVSDCRISRMAGVQDKRLQEPLAAY